MREISLDTETTGLNPEKGDRIVGRPIKLDKISQTNCDRMLLLFAQKI